VSHLYRLTPKAAGDLKSINAYTAREWGNVQRRKYLGALKHRLEWLAEHPRLGKARPELRGNCYSFPEGEHVIFYAIQPGHIEILSVVHNRSLPDFLRL
jgi:toxin ParE1/3/4